MEIRVNSYTYPLRMVLWCISRIPPLHFLYRFRSPIELVTLLTNVIVNQITLLGDNFCSIDQLPPRQYLYSINDNLMKKILAHCLIIIMIIAGLVKCSKIEDDLGPIGSSDTTITDEDRIEVLQRCESKAAELNNLEGVQDRIQFLTWLFTQPAFSSAGFAGEDLYALFTDNRIVFFVTTPLADDIGGRVATEGRTEHNNSNQITTSGRTGDLPKTIKVSLFNGMGRYFEDNTAAIQSIFSAAKTQYQVERKVASIANLKNVSGDAVFYFFTHGGAGDIPRPSKKDTLHVMSLWTTDPVDKASEGLYKNELNQLKLAYMLSTYDNASPVAHYGITVDFIKAHMSFGENCLIYIDACNSFRTNQRAEDYRASVMAKAANNTATYVGWTFETNAVFAPRASQFIFDRLLGANTEGFGGITIPKEDPIQRPFDLAPIFDDLSKNNLDVCANGATLMYTTLNPDEILLTPTIEYLDVDEYTYTLIIHGLFGHDEGKVTVNGANVSVTSWSPDYISCLIPEIGNGSVGDVIVASPLGHKSNPVPLTEWLIKVAYSSDDNHARLEGVCTLRLRADVHPARRKPNETPKRPIVSDYFTGGLFNKKGSSATYTIGGKKYETCTLDGCTYKYTETIAPKSGKIGFALTTGEPFVVAHYLWGPERKSIIIDGMTLTHPETQSTYVAQTQCPPAAENVVSFSSPFSSAFDYPLTNQSSNQFQLEIADNYNIRPGVVHQSVAKPWSGCHGNGKFEEVLQWEMVQPNYAPTEQTPARKSTADVIGN